MLQALRKLLTGRNRLPEFDRRTMQDEEDPAVIAEYERLLAEATKREKERRGQGVS